MYANGDRRILQSMRDLVSQIEGEFREQDVLSTNGPAS